MTEKKKLIKTLEDMEVKHFNVFWGDDAHKLTEEERAKSINDVLYQVAEDNKNTVQIRLSDLKYIYIALKSLIRLSQIDVKEYVTTPKEIRELKRLIHSKAEFPCMMAGQILSKQDREDCLKELED